MRSARATASRHSAAMVGGENGASFGRRAVGCEGVSGNGKQSCGGGDDASYRAQTVDGESCGKQGFDGKDGEHYGNPAFGSKGVARYGAQGGGG